MHFQFWSFCTRFSVILLFLPTLNVHSCLGQESKVDFARDVRPLLSDRCFSCHGPDEEHREADFRADDIESLKMDRGGYQVAKPGDSSASELVKRILSADADEVMPPPNSSKPLTDEEKQLLVDWIDEGLTWTKHWAYETPKSGYHPLATDQGPLNNWIDSFVAEKLAASGASFSPAADRITLLRRLSFDITGLPPKIEDLERFDSESEIELYVERLLSSPAFGERMAIYWLDLVRYADTVGYHGDQDHSISPYRDYVIQAFNDNMPFDQFTIEQLAGDLLENPTEEQVIATGYNRLLQTSHEGGVQPKEYLAIYQADRVRNVSAVWFGATIGCAQCHDHKYDPITAKDFYALAAFFADVDEQQHFKVGTNSLPTKRPPEIEVLSRSQKLRIAEIEFALANLEGKPANKREKASRELIAEKGKISKATRRCMVTESVSPRDVRFLPRGNWLDDSGQVMDPAVPEFLGTLPGEGRSNRMHLARWLTDESSGVGLLTARVFVNRLWMLLFGEGLSRSVEDFGGQGEAPDHPELLDRLALEFVQSGWDIKHMLRLIVGSRTYQQSSLETEWHRENDPENRLLARQNRFRLPAEMVRDVALSCSGLLVREVGGASVKPYQPPAYYRHLNFPVRKYTASKDSGQWRRGVYVHWQRQFLHPMLSAFDAPSREECTAKRARSNTPIAALVWLNDPSFVEAAKFFAMTQSSARNQDSDSIETMRRMFRVATSRFPDEEELEMLSELLEKAERFYAADKSAASQLLNVGQTPTLDSIPQPAWAAWTLVARAILNLNETYARN